MGRSKEISIDFYDAEKGKRRSCYDKIRLSATSAYKYLSLFCSFCRSLFATSIFYEQGKLMLIL